MGAVIWSYLKVKPCKDDGNWMSNWHPVAGPFGEAQTLCDPFPEVITVCLTDCIPTIFVVESKLTSSRSNICYFYEYETVSPRIFAATKFTTITPTNFGNFSKILKKTLIVFAITASHEYLYVLNWHRLYNQPHKQLFLTFSQQTQTKRGGCRGYMMLTKDKVADLE